ncbi:MAG: nitroreductase [Acidimicrobiia bacterium]|nr:MAG: nitroreductase [Acidimicrobiia bacterium]
MSTDFFDVVGRQRAHRAFADRPVSDEHLARVLGAAVHAPSAENKQPWEFVVVRDPQRRAAIGELIRTGWETRGRSFSRDRLPPSLFEDVDRGARGGVAGAPVLVVVCADVERGLEQTVASSIFPAVQNLLLAATAIGLGSALTTIAVGYASELAGLLALTDHVRPVAVVPLGWPARRLGAPRRDPFERHTHREVYGTGW